MNKLLLSILGKRITKGLLITALSLSGIAANAASPLFGLSTGLPEIGFASTGGVEGASYDSGTGTITLKSSAQFYTTAENGKQFFEGFIDLTACIDNAGTFCGLGTFTITGTGISGVSGNPLLDGSVEAYGIADLNNPGTDRIEFKLIASSGELMGVMGGGEILLAVRQAENSSYAGSFAYDWFAEPIKGIVGPIPNVNPVGGTGTIGFWKTHPEVWEGVSLTIGGTLYDQEQLLAILNMAVKGDKTIAMAKQLIGAKLNILSGTESSCIDNEVADADSWLSGHGGVGSGQRQWDGGDLTHDELDSYNNGQLCAPHRG